jgi:hypothetical protein
MMLTISREAIVKVQNHAWNGFCLGYEAFGLFLGKKNEQIIYAALPCFQIQIDYENPAQIPEIDLSDFIKNAQFVGQKFELEVIGCYTTQWKMIKNSEVIKQANINLVMKYHPSLCCKSCSGYSFEQGGKELEYYKGDYSVPSGKRVCNEINQKKILKEWNSFNYVTSIDSSIQKRKVCV